MQANPEVNDFLGKVAVDVITKNLSEKQGYYVEVSIHEV